MSECPPAPLKNTNVTNFFTIGTGLCRYEPHQDFNQDCGQSCEPMLPRHRKGIGPAAVH